MHSLDSIVADRGPYKTRYPVSYLVLAMRYFLPSLPQKAIEETGIILKDELLCIKKDLTGWGDIIAENEEKRDRFYKLLKYREVKIFDPLYKDEYSTYLLYDTFHLERLVESTFLKKVNLPAILSEPHIAKRMGLPEEISVQEWMVPFSDDTVRTVLHKIEEKYIGLSARFRDKVIDHILETLPFSRDQTFGEEAATIPSMDVKEVLGD